MVDDSLIKSVQKTTRVPDALKKRERQPETEPQLEPQKKPKSDKDSEGIIDTYA